MKENEIGTSTSFQHGGKINHRFLGFSQINADSFATEKHSGHREEDRRRTMDDILAVLVRGFLH